jgi:Uma2 family endonuclease
MHRMSQIAPRVTPNIPEKPDIPPLQNGDHLTRDEFERRWDATPGLKKAELIEGEVYMAPPVSFDGHAEQYIDLAGIIAVYRSATPGVRAGGDGSVRLDLDNMPQPDAFLFIVPASGGQAKVEDHYVIGAPELVAEVAYSSASNDLHRKLNVYRRNGAREYLVWRTRENQFDYFILRQSKYERLSPSPDGSFHSEVFPGLWLDADALCRGDLAGALARLQQGLASPEHQTFIQHLQQRAAANQSANQP